MSTTVEVKNSRLIIKKNGRLVSDGGGSFSYAETNNRFIVVLLNSGRIQLLRLDGRFIKDISATSDGAHVRILSDDTIIWRDHGREMKCNVSSHYRATVVNTKNTSFKGAKNPEELGAAFANLLISKLKELIFAIYAKIKKS